MIFCCGSNSFGQIGHAFPTNVKHINLKNKYNVITKRHSFHFIIKLLFSNKHPISLHSNTPVKRSEEKDQRKDLADDDIADIQCGSTLTVFLHK